MSDEIYIRYVVVDDIDFAPMLGKSLLIRIEPTALIQDFVDKIVNRHPSLQSYDPDSFDVLKIKKPVPRETVISGNDLETLKRCGAGSLQSILRWLIERTREAKRTELANDYVQILPDDIQVQKTFRREDGQLISAIVVRQTTPERAEKDRNRPLEPGTTFRHKNLYGIIHGSPPSEILGHHGTNLRAYALIDRPANRYTFPVALFDENLALLQYRLENLNVLCGSDKTEQLFPKELDFYKVADEFIVAAIQDYSSEKERLIASTPFLKAIFRNDLELQYKVAKVGRSETLSVNENPPNTKFDGAYVTKIEADDSSITTTIVEVKTTVYGDPLAQLAKGYAEEVYGFKNKNYFESTYFPKIFVALNGHKLEISIAVCLETVVVNEILSLDIRDNFSRNELKQKLARVAEAMKECSIQLNTYYSKLTAGQRHSSYFPSPTLEPLDASKPLIRGAFEASPPFRGLKIVGRLGRNNEEMDQKDQPEPADMRHNLFLAKWLDHADDDPELIVKLTKRYSEAAHECLVRKKLAPKLHLCQPVIGNFIVVVMERATGSPLRLPAPNMLGSKHLVFKQLKRVVRALNRSQLVHGDLRAPNIIVDAANPEAVTMKVVDFDWAAKHDEGFYPNTINTEELRDQWHSDVGPMKKMKMEHDAYAVFNVLGPKYFGIAEEPSDDEESSDEH